MISFMQNAKIRAERFIRNLSIFEMILLLGSAVFTALYFRHNLPQEAFSLDFETFYLQADAVLSHKNPIQVSGTKLGWHLKPYSPITSIAVTLPFALADFKTASILFLVLNLALYCMSIREILRIVRLKGFERILFVSLAAVFHPALESMTVGQFGIIVLFSILNFFKYLEKEKYVPASFFLALAVSLKFTPIVLLLFVFNFRVHLLTGLIYGLFLLYSFFWFGYNYFTEYWFSVFPGLLNTADVCQFFNQSFSSFVECRMPGFEVSVWMLKLSVFLFMYLAYLLKNNMRKHMQTALSGYLMISVLGPISWPNHLPFVLIVIALFLSENRMKSAAFFYIGIFYIFSVSVLSLAGKNTADIYHTLIIDKNLMLTCLFLSLTVMIQYSNENIKRYISDRAGR